MAVYPTLFFGMASRRPIPCAVRLRDPYQVKKNRMKKFRLIVVFLLGFFAFLCALSYLSGIEAGDSVAWLVPVGFLSGVLCWVLSRLWASGGKLPDEVCDERNDRA